MSGPRYDSAPATTLAAAFERLTGHPPEGVWAAPGRVNLIGEHTDYNDGLVLPVAVDRCARVAVGRRGDGRVRCVSLQLAAEVSLELAAVLAGQVTGWAAYPLGVLWAMGRAARTVPGVDLVIDSELPVGAGLASSAAVEVAVGLAVTALAGEEITHDELARLCQAGEHFLAAAPTGLMDQLAVLEGRAGHALLLDCASLDRELVPFEPHHAGAVLLVIDTTVTHTTSDAAYRTRREQCEEAARRLGVRSLRDATVDDVDAHLSGVLQRRARHVVNENERVRRAAAMLRRGDTVGIGPLLSAGHASLRDDYEVSCPELDLAVEVAVASGASGARMTGAGFGGCAIAIAPVAASDDIAAALGAAFAAARFAAPRAFAVTAADGAHRLG